MLEIMTNNDIIWSTRFTHSVSFLPDSMAFIIEMNRFSLEQILKKLYAGHYTMDLWVKIWGTGPGFVFNKRRMDI